MCIQVLYGLQTEGYGAEITFDRVRGKLSLFDQQQMGTRLSSELGKV